MGAAPPALPVLVRCGTRWRAIRVARGSSSRSVRLGHKPPSRARQGFDRCLGKPSVGFAAAIRPTAPCPHGHGPKSSVAHVTLGRTPGLPSRFLHQDDRMSELSTSEFESIVNAVAAEQSGIVSVTTSGFHVVVMVLPRSCQGRPKSGPDAPVEKWTTCGGLSACLGRGERRAGEPVGRAERCLPRARRRERGVGAMVGARRGVLRASASCRWVIGQPVSALLAAGRRARSRSLRR